MRRVFAILGSAVFLVIAPGIVAGYLPWRICGWHFGPPWMGIRWLRLLGVLFIAAGLPVLLDSFAGLAERAGFRCATKRSGRTLWRNLTLVYRK